MAVRCMKGEKSRICGGKKRILEGTALSSVKDGGLCKLEVLEYSSRP